MQNERAAKPHISQPLSLLKSKRCRNIFYLIIIFLSVPVMLCADVKNSIRAHAFPFLNNFTDVIKQLNIRRYDITVNVWILFAIVLIFALTIIVANIIAPSFVTKKAEKHAGLFKHKSNTRLFVATFYYGALVLLAAVIILIMFLAGAFAYFGKRAEVVSPFSSLLTMLKNYVIAIAILTVIIFILYMIIRIIAVTIIGILRLKNPEKYDVQKETEPEQETESPDSASEPAVTVASETNNEQTTESVVATVVEPVSPIVAKETSPEKTGLFDATVAEPVVPVAKPEKPAEITEELIRIKLTDEED